VAVFPSVNGRVVFESFDERVTGVSFGSTEDKPIPNAFIR
jgi:hypothetical protein